MYTKLVLKHILLDLDLRRDDIDIDVYSRGCSALKKNKLLQKFFNKIKRESIVRLTDSQRLFLTKEEQAHIRGGLYVINELEKAIATGANNEETQGVLEEYFDN
jgi:hypothetical protein